MIIKHIMNNQILKNSINGLSLQNKRADKNCNKKDTHIIQAVFKLCINKAINNSRTAKM